MSDHVPGTAPVRIGFGGNLLGKPIYVNDEILETQASSVDTVAGELRAAVKTFTPIQDTVMRLPRNLPYPTGNPIEATIADIAHVVQALNLVAGQLEDEGTAIRNFAADMRRVDVTNMGLFDPFALAVATSRVYGEQADDVIGETSSVITIKVSIGPQAKLKLWKVDVGVGAAATVDVKVMEHITYFRDGTVEVTYSTGGGIGGETGAGPKSEQPATVWGLDADVRIGADGATTYRIKVDELDDLRTWIQDGYKLDKVWRGDPPGVEVSTTTSISMSEQFAASVEKGGEHDLSASVEGSVAETVMSRRNGGLDKGDTVTTAAFTAASSGAVRERMGLPKLSVDGSITYAVSVVRDKDGNLKSIEISEARTGGAGGRGDFGDPSKKHASLSAGASRTTVTTHRIDVEDNPAMRSLVNEAFAVAIYKNGGAAIPSALDIADIVRKHGVETSNAVEASTHAGGSAGGRLGVGFDVSVDTAGVDPVSTGEVEAAVERDR